MIGYSVRLNQITLGLWSCVGLRRSDESGRGGQGDSLREPTRGRACWSVTEPVFGGPDGEVKTKVGEVVTVLPRWAGKVLCRAVFMAPWTVAQIHTAVARGAGGSVAVVCGVRRVHALSVEDGARGAIGFEKVALDALGTARARHGIAGKGAELHIGDDQVVESSNVVIADGAIPSRAVELVVVSSLFATETATHKGGAVVDGATPHVSGAVGVPCAGISLLGSARSVTTVCGGGVCRALLSRGATCLGPYVADIGVGAARDVVGAGGEAGQGTAIVPHGDAGSASQIGAVALLARFDEVVPADGGCAAIAGAGFGGLPRIAVAVATDGGCAAVARAGFRGLFRIAVAVTTDGGCTTVTGAGFRRLVIVAVAVATGPYGAVLGAGFGGLALVTGSVEAVAVLKAVVGCLPLFADGVAALGDILAVPRADIGVLPLIAGAVATIAVWETTRHRLTDIADAVPTDVAVDRAGKKPLYLGVRTWNKRAINCYQSVGFVIDGDSFELTTLIGRGEFYRMVKVK